jgi:hypothetical protein
MSSYSHIRSVIQTSVSMAVLLLTPVSFSVAADRPQVPAQLLDHAEFLCDNCLFGASDYYYCFAVDNKILIGYQRTRVANWADKSKNYLTSVNPGWAAWTAPGETVPISYDDKHIWITRADRKTGKRDYLAPVKAFATWATRSGGKQVKLTQSSMRDIFLNNDRCRAADGPKAH